MNNFRKVLFVMILSFSAVSFWFAATGTNQTWSDYTYSWDLSKYSESMKNSLITQIDSGYDKLYNDFQKTWLNIMKTVDYQSLVCLGAVSSDSGMFLNMQKDKQVLKWEILKSFADIEIDIATLEEKKRILEKNWVNLFSNGYESEKKSLKKDIDDLVKLEKEKINKYTNNYSSKVKSFVQDFISYKSGNKELISWISDKIFKVKSMSDNYSWLVTKISELNSLLFASSTFELAINNLKKVALNNYENKIVKLAEKKVNTYKKLLWLESILDEEVSKSLDQYWVAFEESLSKVFSKIYRYDRYITLSETFEDLQDTYYPRWKVNCKNILTSDNDNLSRKINLLNKDISDVLNSIETWKKLAQSDWYSKKFKTDIVWAITSFYKTPSSQVYKSFEKTVSDRIRELSNQNSSGLNQDVPTETTLNTWVDLWWITVKQWFVFKNPFRLNEKNEDIKVLQQLLKKLSYYVGEVTWIYDSATLDAVYAFQKVNGILVWYENKPNVWWWMWPATRALLNTYLNK